MSRSFKKHPSVNYVCFSSNKKDKRIANRNLRRTNKQILRSKKSYEKDVELIYPIDYPDDYDVDVYEFWPEEDLASTDFKKMREVSDVWNFESDGLPHPISEHALILDNSIPYDWRNYRTHPRTTIAEARKNHNWETLKYFIRK